MINTTVQHYRILRALGRGGMGEVYAAEDTKLHRQVAIKILPQEMAADPERLQRFRREAHAIAALNHPNVVTVYSVEEAAGLHFLTMELVEGKTLVDLLPRRGFPVGDFLHLAVPLVDAVGAAHQRGIVHRDLKPANIMVGADRRLKVLDFGLAKLRPEAGGDDPAIALTTAQLTAEQRVLGTAAYMSPEQAEGRPADQRSDVFSLGVVLYEMATGSRPFKGDTPISVISSILKDTPAKVTDLNSGLPEGLDRILRRCLAKDPSRRYQTAIDLRNELEDLADTTPRTRRLGSPFLLGALAAAAVVGVGAAVIVFFATRSRDAAPRTATFARITATAGREWFPSLSPDGKWVVYGSDANGNFDVFLQSVSGSYPVNLTRDSPADDDMPVFSPDGERIAFRSSRDGGGIFVMGRTGEAVRRLTREGFNPAWSPDGSEIAFTSGRMDVNPQNSEGRTELFVVGVNGGEPRRLVAADAIQPSWSPHKKRIAYGSRLLNNNRRRADLWTVPVGGGTATPVLEDAPYDWNPIWSPDGGHLYFISSRGGTMNLWRVAIDEDTGLARGAPEPAPTPAPFCAHPSISADGKHLAYSSVLISTNIQKLAIDPVSGASGDAAWVTSGSRVWSDPDPSPDGLSVAFYSTVEPLGDLYLSGTDGTQLRQLTSDAALDRMPHWSPDGVWISMFSNRSGRLQIWKIHPDGSDLRQVTDDPGGIAYSTWSPDGRRLAVAPRDVTKIYIVDSNRPWNEQTPEVASGFPGDEHEVRVNSWSSDGRRLAGDLGQTATVKGVLTYTFSTRKWERLTEFGEWPVWFPDNRRLLFGDGGKSFWIVDSLTREVKKIYSGGRDVLGPPRLTRDGRAAFYSRRINESDIWLMTLQ